MARLLPFVALACAGCWVPLYDEDRPSSRARVDAGDPLTRGESEKLLRAGVSDGVIVEKARRSGAAPLTADDIVALKKAGASDELLKELIANERRAVAPSTTYVVVEHGWWPGFWIGSSCGGSYGTRGHGHVHRGGVRVGW